MGVNFSSDLYALEQDQWSRPVTFTPLVSQPGGEPYQKRGIYDSGPTNVLLDDGSLFSDQQTILDILTDEYPVPPVQGDQVYIGPDTTATIPTDAEGDFEIINVWDNGGGETTLQLRAIKTAP